MKRFGTFSLGLLFLVLVTGCDINVTEPQNDYKAPNAPTNVYSVTGDSKVELYWDGNRESDLAGYNVYYSTSYNGTYTYIGSSNTNSYIDYDVQNGETYYYAVTAYDYHENESELSYDEVFDTPRPEGFNQTIFEFNDFPAMSGYSFATNRVVAYNNSITDFFFEIYQNTFYLDVWKDTDIQDMGLTTDIYDISYAPLDGYVTINAGENIKYVKAVVGHTYVIWTMDNHYAKVRISKITNERITFDWAYQTAEGNRELKRNVTNFRENMSDLKVERF